jgi:hypothetical protein
MGGLKEWIAQVKRTEIKKELCPKTELATILVALAWLSLARLLLSRA